MLGQALATLSEKALVIILSLLVLLVVTVVASRLIHALTLRLRARLQDPNVSPERRSRLETLLTTAGHTAQIFLWGVAVLMALAVIGINIGPIIATAGVAGLAVSLGAQTVIKDYIGGLLILLEDQFHVGDSIVVGDVTGTVERVELRVTYVRDAAGRLWAIPNGDIRTLSNQTRGWSRAVVDLNVGFDTDAGRALSALEAAMGRAIEDPGIKDLLIEAPQILGFNSMTDWAVQVRVSAKTMPGKQWDVARVLRQYALAGLSEAGIRIALPPASPGAATAPQA